MGGQSWKKSDRQQKWVGKCPFSIKGKQIEDGQLPLHPWFLTLLMAFKGGTTWIEKTQDQLIFNLAPSSGDILNKNFDLPIERSSEALDKYLSCEDARACRWW